MSSPSKITISHSAISSWVKEIFLAGGLDEEDAKIATDVIITADLRGVFTHGVMRVPLYIKRFELKVNDCKGKAEVVRNVGATGLIDGHNAIGQVVAYRAMQLAIEKAKQFGVGYVAVRGSNHFGAAAYFSMMAAKEDMIGMAGTIGATLNMAPWGGSERLLGNNPFSIAIPALHKDTVVLDMAQSVVARGKIIMAMKTKQPIPETWALAPDGSPTTDPVQAYHGSLRPLGDYKGYGLTLMNGLISSMLSSASFGREVTDFNEDFTTPQNSGHYMQAVNISAFRDPEEFKAKIDEAVELMHNSQKMPGVNEILVPGEPEARMARKQLQEGITYPLAVIEELNALSAKLGVKSRIS